MADDIYRFGEFSLSPRERRLFGLKQAISLSPKAFDALSLMVRNHGSLVSREELFAALWPGIHVSEANLTNIIVTLRKALGREAIQTVSKFGYRFTLPVTGEPGIDPQAYQSFIRGKELLARRSAESILEARERFWFCIARCPQFAPAWAWLGRTSRLAVTFELPAADPDLAEAAFQRAFALDPDLACAHQFYTQVEIDSSHAAKAAIRLSSRMSTHGENPETLAALVTVLRYCGLLDDSLAANRRALALDSAIQTSVAHTHFLRRDYASVLENYGSSGLYLDAAAWAALGDTERAISMIRSRLAQQSCGAMGILMRSLLAVLDNRRDEAVDFMQSISQFRDPEGVFYFARHFAMLNATEQTLEVVRRAREGGFWCSYSLETDPVFAPMRECPQFIAEIENAMRLEAQAGRDARRALGPELTATILGNPSTGGERAREKPAPGQSRSEEGFRVAVLPFKCASIGNAELAPLVEELAVEIVTGLSRFSYLRVIAPIPSMLHSQAITDIRAVGQELGARYIVDGSIRKRSENLLISVQLVDASSGVHLWAEIYERPFQPERVSSLKDDIVPRVVSTIADTYGVLTHTMSEALRTKSPSTLSPYEAVLRCFGYYARITPDEHAEVRASLESALAEAPNNADVAAMLAIIYLDEYSVGFNLRPDPLQRSLECAMRATVAAPSNSLSHYALACARFFRKEFAGFRTAVERCIALNPMNGSSLAGLGLMMSAGVGDWARGVSMAQRAIDLNPNHPGWYWFALAYDAYHHRDYREALSFAFRINMPGFYNVHTFLAASYAQIGELDAAMQSMQTALALRPDFALTTRQECEKWFCRELVTHLLEGFHKAGMPIHEREGHQT